MSCTGPLRSNEPSNDVGPVDAERAGGTRRGSESNGNLRFSQNPVLDYYHSTTRGVQPHNCRTPIESGILERVSITRQYGAPPTKYSPITQPPRVYWHFHWHYSGWKNGRDLYLFRGILERRESKFVCGEKFARARAAETDKGNFLPRYCQLEGWDRVFRVGSSGHSGNGSFVH